MDKSTEAEPKTDITDFVNVALYELRDIRAQFGREPKEIKIDFDRLVQRFRETRINATYRQE